MGRFCERAICIKTNSGDEFAGNPEHTGACGEEFVGGPEGLAIGGGDSEVKGVEGSQGSVEAGQPKSSLCKVVIGEGQDAKEPLAAMVLELPSDAVGISGDDMTSAHFEGQERHKLHFGEPAN